MQRPRIYSFEEIIDPNTTDGDHAIEQRQESSLDINPEDIYLTPFPDVNSTVDGVGRPYPLGHGESYVEVRKLDQAEILKCEKNKPPLPKQKDAVNVTFRPIDSLHPIATQSDEDTALGRQLVVEDPFFSTKNLLSNPPLQNTCTEIQEDRLLHGRQIGAKCNWDQTRRARRLWHHLLPPDIHSLPIYAVRIRWPLGHRTWTYTLELLHGLLSRFGPIVSIGQLSPNSAVVVFHDVKTATQAVRCSQLGTTCHFNCTWWFEEMWNYDKMTREKKLREKVKPMVVYDELTIFKMKFKLLQQKVAEQLRKGKKKMHYDMASLIP